VRRVEYGTRLAIASLGVWRVTHLLAEEDGPFDAVVRLRRRVGSGQIGELMDCFYCLSVWVAVPPAFVLAARRREAPVLAFALSGAACLLERATADRSTPVQSTGRSIDELLWQEAQGV
jgi:Protein of unknown function (DUF1360)